LDRRFASRADESAYRVLKCQLEENAMPVVRNILFAAVTLVAIGAAAPAFADMEKFKADLTGPGEVPPTTSKGTGAIEATYDTATKTLTWSGSYSGLTGPEIAAHFHGPAALGKNAAVMVPVDAKESPFKGSATLTDEQAKAFADGLVYFNIHTPANKPGEIRGQMMMEK